MRKQRPISSNKNTKQQFNTIQATPLNNTQPVNHGQYNTLNPSERPKSNTRVEPSKEYQTIQQRQGMITSST